MNYVSTYHCRLCNSTFQLDEHKESTPLHVYTQLEPFINGAPRFPPDTPAKIIHHCSDGSLGLAEIVGYTFIL